MQAYGVMGIFVVTGRSKVMPMAAEFYWDDVANASFPVDGL